MFRPIFSGSSMLSSRRLLPIIAVLLVAPWASADPFVESISPPVLEVGKTTRITLVGRELANAEGLWLSAPGKKILAKSIASQFDKAVFELIVDKETHVGICGLRIATRNGLGNCCLILIDDLSVGQFPGAMWGALDEATLDKFRIDVKAGEKLSFEAVANRLGKDADPLVRILDPDGKLLAERDNDPGLYFDCRFEHTFAKTGTHTVEIRDARYKGTPHNKYVLRIGKFPADRVATKFTATTPGLAFTALKGEQASAWVPEWGNSGPGTVARSPWAKSNPMARQVRNLSPRWWQPVESLLMNCGLQATPATVPGELFGTVAQPGWRPAFALKLAKGQKIYVKGEAKSLNSPADLELIVLDKTGREQRRTGDTELETPFDYTAPQDGEYRLVVRDRLHDGGADFTFRLSVRGDPFPPKVSAEVEGLTIPRGSYQPIPILVARSGTTGAIPLKLLGAPPGMKLTPSEIGEKETAVVCKLEADGTTPLGLHTIQIVTDGGEPVLTQPLIDKRIINVDLIPHALREDQRRLPPSVADRFAVFITPAAPFTFELPQTLVTLPRYQKAAIPIATTRLAGLDGPIQFEARGGQLADKNEGRTRVYTEFPEATAKQPNVNGTAASKILSNLAKARIDVRATGTCDGRRVTLIRCFDLNLVPAFHVVPESTKLMLDPGSSAMIRLKIDRVPSFDGPVLLHLNPQDGLKFEENITVPKGKSIVEFKVTAAPDAMPLRFNLQMIAKGTVSGYEEEVRAPQIEIEVKASPKAK